MNNWHLTVHNPREPEQQSKFRKGHLFWIAGLVISLGMLIYSVLDHASVGYIIWYTFWAGTAFGCLYAEYSR